MRTKKFYLLAMLLPLFLCSCVEDDTAITEKTEHQADPSQERNTSWENHTSILTYDGEDKVYQLDNNAWENSDGSGGILFYNVEHENPQIDDYLYIVSADQSRLQFDDIEVLSPQSDYNIEYISPSKIKIEHIGAQGNQVTNELMEFKIEYSKRKGVPTLGVKRCKKYSLIYDAEDHVYNVGDFGWLTSTHNSAFYFYYPTNGTEGIYMLTDWELDTVKIEAPETPADWEIKKYSNHLFYIEYVGDTPWGAEYVAEYNLEFVICKM